MMSSGACRIDFRLSLWVGFTEPWIKTVRFTAYIRLLFSSASGCWSKRRQIDRQSQAARLLHWAERASVELHEDLRDQINDGFGNSSTGEDRFDATVGLFGMLEVISGRRSSGEPDDSKISSVEGWIFGQCA